VGQIKRSTENEGKGETADRELWRPGERSAGRRAVDSPVQSVHHKRQSYEGCKYCTSSKKQKKKEKGKKKGKGKAKKTLPVGEDDSVTAVVCMYVCI